MRLKTVMIAFSLALLASCNCYAYSDERKELFSHPSGLSEDTVRYIELCHKLKWGGGSFKGHVTPKKCSKYFRWWRDWEKTGKWRSP